MMEDNSSNEQARIRQLVSRYITKRWAAHDDLPAAADYDKSGIRARILLRIGNRAGTRRMYAWSAAAAVLLIAISALYLFRDVTGNVEKALAVHQVSMGDGPRFVELPDGSAAWLNNGSTLCYPEGLGAEGIREVFLEGEAFFSVKTDSRRPFQVRSGGVRTTVLGTAFNVSATAHTGQTEVVVINGRVQVEALDDGHSPRQLTANQRSLHGAAGQLLEFSPQYDASQRVEWIAKAFRFKSTTVAEIAAQVASRFGHRIAVAPAIRDCILTADFSDEGFDGMMQALALLVGGRYEIHDGAYHLIGTGCPQ